MAVNETTGGGPEARGRGPTDEELERAVPRERGGRELRVGVFVLIGLLSFVVALFLLTDPATLRGRYMVVTMMEDAGGVRRGDPIQMRGVNIGRLHTFEMTPDGRVAVTMEIEGEWDIPEGSIATLGASGIFGGRTVEVVPGDGAHGVEPWDTIPGSSAAGDLMETATELGERAETVLARISATLDEPTVGTIQGTTRELQALITELRQIAAVQRSQLQTLTTSLNRSAEGLESAAEAGPGVASAVARADSALLQLNRTSATLDRVAGRLDLFFGRMEAGEGTLGRLSTDDSLYVNLNQAAAEISLLARDIRENPGRYITVEIF